MVIPNTTTVTSIREFHLREGGQKSLYNVSMRMSTPLTLDEIVEQLKRMVPLLRQKYHVRTLEVFGSYVRGEEQENSDLDLLVTFDEVPTLFQYVALENDLSDALNVKVDLVMKDSLKPSVRERILKEARTI